MKTHSFSFEVAGIMELINNPRNSDLQNIWLLATLGSKAQARKSFHKEILETRIPDVCVRLIKYSGHTNIRVSSSIMFGVTVAYRKQVERMLEDVNWMKNRLTVGLAHTKAREVLPVFQLVQSSHNESLFKDYERSLSRHNLEDDPEFSLERDFVSGFQEELGEDPITKRRRIAIEKYDKEIFSGFTRMTPMSSLSGNGMHSRPSTFLGFNLLTTHDKDEDIEFELNGDGFLVLKERSLDLVEEKNNDELFQDLEMEGELPKQVFQLIQEEQTCSISNDADFALASHPRILHPAKANLVQEKDLLLKLMSNLRFCNLQVDEVLMRIPSSVLIESHRMYELHMKEAQLRRTISNRVTQLTSRITKELNRLVFNIASDENTTLLNSILRDLERHTRQLFDQDAELEYPKRRLLHENILTEFNDHFNIDLENLHRATLLPPSSDIFDLEIGILQHNNSSRGHLTSRDFLAHEVGFGTRDDCEEIDNVQTSNTCIGQTTTLFLEFLVQRARQLGEPKRFCPYPLKVLDEAHEAIIRYTGESFGSIEFNKLIPTSNASNLLELPVSRTAAANGFASLLTLASKELIYVSCEPHVNWWNPASFTVIVPYC